MNYKILMVDDDRELLKMLNQYFTLKNYTVMIAENGIEAMEKISANPDIILLDVNMPGMDGIEVCRRIRDMVSCPIIFLTAKVEEQDRVMGLLSGGDDYVLKPFSLKELDARIIAHLKREERLHRKKEQRFYGELVIDYASKCVHIKGNALELTKLEAEAMEPGTLKQKKMKLLFFRRASGRRQLFLGKRCGFLDSVQRRDRFLRCFLEKQFRRKPVSDCRIDDRICCTSDCSGTGNI